MVGMDKKKKGKKKSPAYKIKCCNLNELTDLCLELTHIQTSVASRQIQSQYYGLASPDCNTCWIVFCSYFYQHRGTVCFICFLFCQLTCNFDSSMIRVIELHLPS